MITYNLVDGVIIHELKKMAIYETFMAQIKRVPPAPRQVFVFQHSQPDRLCFYIYHQNFVLETDNGFSAIVIVKPDNCPEVVEAVKSHLEQSFDSPIKVLWTDYPAQRN